MIVKPCKQSEIDFYESTSSHPNILPFIPTYMGRLSLGSITAQAAGALIPPGETTPEDSGKRNTATLPLVDHAWAPSNGGKIHTDLAVVLENVAAGYRKPNILDVKLGARLWADDAPAEKRDRLDKAAEETTSKSLGFRIAGMKTYQGADGDGEDGSKPLGYNVFDKHYGRSFNEQTVHTGFKEYFCLAEGVKPIGAVKKVIRRFREDLQEMFQVIESEESRMYSASLLFVYEGDSEALRDAFEREGEALSLYKDQHGSNEAASEEEDIDVNSVEGRSDFPSIQTVKLIDFAHAQWTPNQGPDENLLHGIRSVIEILKQLIH